MIEDRFRVLIAISNREEGEALCRTLENTGRFAVIGITDDGLSCVQRVLVERPQLVLVDLALREIDGLETIRRLNHFAPAPTILALASGTPALCERAVSAGARLCLLRPYMPSAVAARAINLMTPPMELVSDGAIEWATWDICRSLGAPIHLQGFRCVREAVRLILRDERYLTKITDRLYPAIKENCRFQGNVEKNIRDFISKLYQSGDLSALERCYAFRPNEHTGKLTNRAFLTAMAHQVRFLLSHSKDENMRPEESRLG